jgi:hypothetical protein
LQQQLEDGQVVVDLGGRFGRIVLLIEWRGR